MRSGRAQAVALRLVLIGLPLAALAACFALAGSYRPAPPQTGDKLLDAFAAEFDQPGLLPWSSATLAAINTSPGQLLKLQLGLFNPDSPRSAYRAPSVLDQIDPALASDPRYWELLARSGRLNLWHDLHSDLQPRGENLKLAVLDEARARGVANTSLLIARLDAADRWYSSSGPGDSAPGGNKVTWPVEQWQQREQRFREASAGELDTLLNELLRTGAGDAAASYVAARDETERGNYDRAAQLLAQGNRLTQCSNFTTIDPATFWQTASPPGYTWLIENQVLGNYYARSLPNYIRWKDFVKKLAMTAAQRGDRQGLQEVHDFACRFARNGSPNTMGNLVGAVMCGLPASALQDLSPKPLTTADLQGLGEQHALRAKFKALAKGQNRSIALPNLMQDHGLGMLCGMLSNGDTTSLDMLKLGHDEELKEVAFARDQFGPLWDEMARFDYRTMSFTPADAPSR